VPARCRHRPGLAKSRRHPAPRIGLPRTGSREVVCRGVRAVGAAKVGQRSVSTSAWRGGCIGTLDTSVTAAMTTGGVPDTSPAGGAATTCSAATASTTTPAALRQGGSHSHEQGQQGQQRRAKNHDDLLRSVPHPLGVTLINDTWEPARRRRARGLHATARVRGRRSRGNVSSCTAASAQACCGDRAGSHAQRAPTRARR